MDHRPTPPASSTGLSTRAGSFIAYLFGWITGVMLLLAERRDPEIRFHAAQSVLLFGGMTLLLSFLSWLAQFVGIGPVAAFLFILLAFPATMLWIFMMIIGFQERHLLVPPVGDLAERLAGRSRR